MALGFVGDFSQNAALGRALHDRDRGVRLLADNGIRQLWRRDGEHVLALFQGPHAYVSPAFYEQKAISGKVVPTWNYAVVHAHGRLRAIDDPAWLHGLLQRLTERHEAPRAAPWSMTR